MNKPRYGIKRFYRTRPENKAVDTRESKDEWQLEIYLHALGLMKKHNLSSVLDIGCGSGYKLITYLGEYETIGTELSPAYETLLERYPDRKWVKSDFEMGWELKADVIICSDVIEHLPDPDMLCNFINDTSYKYVVFSTPDRDLRYRFGMKGYWGPPGNVGHVREWNSKEFRTYLSRFFDVVDSRVTNLNQWTQMAICKPMSASNK